MSPVLKTALQLVVLSTIPFLALDVHAEKKPQRILVHTDKDGNVAKGSKYRGQVHSPEEAVACRKEEQRVRTHQASFTADSNKLKSLGRKLKALGSGIEEQKNSLQHLANAYRASAKRGARQAQLDRELRQIRSLEKSLNDKISQHTTWVDQYNRRVSSLQVAQSTNALMIDTFNRRCVAKGFMTKQAVPTPAMPSGQ